MDDVESLRSGSTSLVLREPIKPLQDRIDVLLSFLYRFDCVALSKREQDVSKDRPTQSSLFELFGSQSERGKQFEYNLEDYLICCGRRRNACIYIDTPKKEFDGLEQVNECVMVRIKAVDHLVHLDVTRIPIQELENCTYGK